MIFEKQLIPAKLVRRYKRFLADVELKNGEILTVHCPNSGSMKSCMSPGWPVQLSQSANPNRKYIYTWEMVHNGKCWIGINTGIPNIIAKEAITRGVIGELQGYPEIRKEVKYGRNSRIDLLLRAGAKCCYVEVKNVTLVEEEDCFYFPDAVTERGKKHLYELADVYRQGQRAVMLYIVQRSDGRYFKPAEHIDPAYAHVLKQVHRAGVEILVYRAEVNPRVIEVIEKVPWQFT
jgi:sugar fermentation stimulation protein A